MKNLYKSALGVAVLLGAHGSALAQESTDTLTLTAEVAASSLVTIEA